MVMNPQKKLRDRCHVNDDRDNRFVGLKADTGDAVIHFPIGYELPPNDDDLRADINNLLHVLASFMREDSLLEKPDFSASQAVNFPMHAYLKIIRAFLRTGRYYIETDPKYKTDTRGYVSWPRTVRNQRGLIQKNGSLIFTNMTVRSVTPNADKEITQIHRYCVYEAFDKMGWLYVPYMPEMPGRHPENREAICILEKKLSSTHNDMDHELFSAMISILKCMDEKSPKRQGSFGTDFFEHVWEGMIDKAFGIKDKDQYFPRTRWLLDYGPDRERKPLQPDTVMIYNDKIYILDAKLYRYGYSGNPDHLPSGPDINKQITYGEYVAHTRNIPNENLYNAFIMPFNRKENPFLEKDSNGNFTPSSAENIKNIGEAIGDWKSNLKNYERIQGIVIDTRFLMYNYLNMPSQQKQLLAESIEKVNSRPPL